MVDLIIEGLNLKDILIVILVCEGVPCGERLGMLLNILQCIGQSPQQRTVQPKMSVLVKLRKPEIEKLQEYLALIRFNFFIGVGLPRQLV